MPLLRQKGVQKVKVQAIANSLSKNEVSLLKLMVKFHVCTLVFLDNYLWHNPEPHFDFASAMDLLVGKGLVQVQAVLSEYEWYAMTDLGYDVCAIIRRRHLVGHSSTENFDYFYNEHSTEHIAPMKFDLDPPEMV